MFPVDQPPIAEMIAASRRRRGRMQALSIVGGVGVLAVAGVVTAIVLGAGDPQADDAARRSTR